MGDALGQPVVLDATVLSNFASSDAVDWLVDLLNRPTAVPAVRAELDRGYEHGHEFLADAIDEFDDGIPLVEGREAEDPPLLDAAEVRDRLDAGEAESLLCTVELDGTLATDDLAARRLATAYDVPVTGSVGLLVAGVERDVLEVTTANDWLEIWRTTRGYYAPVDRIEDVLDATDG